MTTFAFLCRSAEPGRALTLARQAEALTAAGHAVDIFTSPWPELTQALGDARVRVRPLGAAPGWNASLANVFFWLRVCILITAAQFRRRYHAIQISGATGIFVFTAWLAHTLGGKIVLDVAAIGPETLMDRTGLPRASLRVRAAILMEQLVVDFADHIITISEPLRVRYISRGCPPEKINVIYRAPDENLYGQALSVTRHPSLADRFLVVCRGHAGEEFDYATVIRAVASLRERLPNVLLWVACPDARRAELETLIRSLNATHAVLLQGQMDQSAIPAFIAQADANIVAVPRTSLSDLVLPEGVLESLGLGVPTISVRTQATQFYFDPRTLLVFDSSDVGDLAARIEWLAHHPEARAKLAQGARELGMQMNWSRERHRYVALIIAVAANTAADDARDPAVAAGFSNVSRRPRASIRTYTAAAAMGAGIDLSSHPLADDLPIEDIQTVQVLPLRLSAPSNEWRAGRQLRMRLGAWTLRGLATALLFGMPILASQPSLVAKIFTAIMFALLVFFMVLLPSGEAAIIVALYFIAQRAIFIQFPPEGFLGHVIVYLGSALQLIVFLGFCVRVIVQQRPLQRSAFILWPATLYFLVSIISAFINHVPLSVTALGIEHTLHNLVFVVLIAEDLPTPQQLRWYVSFVIMALCALATVTIIQTGIAFHWFGLHLEHTAWHWLIPQFTPVSIIVPDADTLAYLLNFGILLALAIFVTVNTSESRFDKHIAAPLRLNVGLISAVLILTFALFLTNSVENWIGLLAGALALAFVLREQLRLVLVGYLVALVVLTFVPLPTMVGVVPTSAASQIAGIVHGQFPYDAPVATSFQVIRDHPLLGVGPGRFGGTVAFLTHSPVYTEYHVNLPTELTSIDLFWLHIWGETGIIGLAIFIWLMVQTERTIWRAYRKGAFRRWHGITAGVFGIVIAFSLATFFGNALEVDALSAPFWALVGIAIALPIANRPLIADIVPTLRLGNNPEDDDAHVPPSNSGSRRNGSLTARNGSDGRNASLTGRNSSGKRNGSQTRPTSGDSAGNDTQGSRDGASITQAIRGAEE
jgi:glycosyltransferase involved in cell wall biosynthesis